MQNYLELALRRPKFVDIAFWGPRLSLTMGHRVALADLLARCHVFEVVGTRELS